MAKTKLKSISAYLESAEKKYAQYAHKVLLNTRAETERQVKAALNQQQKIIEVVSPYYTEYRPKSYRRTGQLFLAVEGFFKFDHQEDVYSDDFTIGYATGESGKLDDFGFASRMWHKKARKSGYGETRILANFTVGDHGGYVSDNNDVGYDLQRVGDAKASGVASKVQGFYDKALRATRKKMKFKP